MIKCIILITLAAAMFGGIYILSAWLNRLYAGSPAVLSFPDKVAPEPLMRALKILPFALLLFGARAYILALGGELGAAPVLGQVAFFAAFLVFTLTFFVSDMEQQVIFDKQLLLFAACGLLHSVLMRGQFVEPLLLAAGAGLFFLLLAILTRGGIGGGDIKLVAALALWGGLDEIKLISLGGIVLGGVWALLAMLLQKKSRKDFIPYGPPLIIAALVAYIV